MPADDSESVRLQWGVRIPLRDGIHLCATVYRPETQPTPMPCIVTLTPYLTDTFHGVAKRFAAEGLPFVVVDVRGRGNSEGVFRPSAQDAQDGYDVVEWLARQPYCNGKVGMWGGSYHGYTQWAAARERPPHLATIVPIAAPYRGVDSPMRNNIISPERVQWLMLVSGRASQTRIHSDAAFWSDFYRRGYESGRPFREVGSAFGKPSPLFEEWLAHPEPDEYWDAQNPTAEQYARLEIPILTITGAYDDDQPGALEHFTQHVRHASPRARAQHFLIIGPWDHSSIGLRTEFGGLKVGAASLIDLTRLHLEWYAWTMQEGPRPEFLRKNVVYYVMRKDEWRYADTLNEVTERYESYFLDSTANATDVFAAGSLGPAPGSGRPDCYTFDPADTRGPEVAAQARMARDSLVDQGLTLALRGKQLIYDSAPFEKDVEISGFFKLRAWIAIDCPDTDFYVSIHEIGLDGGSLRLSTDALRARYREGPRMPRLIGTREPLCYEFARFTFVSREIARGHRLRLVIAPLGRIVEASFMQKNYNAGGIVAEESAADSRPVTVRLFHDAAHPSALYVPLAGPGRTDLSG